MCVKLYDRRDEAEQRALGTIITYQGKPFYVAEIGRKKCVDIGLVYLREYGEGDITFVEQEDPELSFACLPLGYVNFPDTAAYAMRTPARRWKQGVDHRAVVFSRTDGRVGGRDRAFDMKQLADCMENIYPSFTKAAGMFTSTNPFKRGGGRDSVAFSKAFSLVEQGRGIAYRGKRVGAVVDGLPTLDEPYRYLIESLDEVMA